MGCTPSHCDIASHQAKCGRTKPLNEEMLPVDPRGEVVSPPVHSSYKIYDSCHGGTPIKDHFLKNSSEEGQNVSFHSSSEDPSISEANQEVMGKEGAVSEAEIAMSELMESHNHMLEDINIRRQNSHESQESQCFVMERKNGNSVKQKTPKGKKQKNGRQGKRSHHSKSKEKSSPPEPKAEKKVDFPERLVKAHQNAYAYLNLSLSKYEVILCMANQAKETQLVLQQIVSFLLFRFDDINHIVEEIAKNGEDLLRKVGGSLAWPVGNAISKEQPDLLQQLLQYTVNKMQVLNGTVASLTSNVLQESCRFLQSSGNDLEEKLKAKHGFEHLLRTIKLLEASIVRPPPPQPDDTTIYSEDSGIGIDSESVKELNFLDKRQIKTNYDARSHDHPSLNQTGLSGEEHRGMCTSLYATARSHDCALERCFKDIFYSPPYTKDVKGSSEVAPESAATVVQHQNITQTHMHSNGTQKWDSFKECDWTNSPFTNEDDDNSFSEDDNNVNLSGKEKDYLPNKSTSSPAATDNKQRLSIKLIQNEEIILKMKDAISEKIKFVPTKSGKKKWTEEENDRGSQPPRPSTATGSQKTQVKQKRSRSEESLRRSPVEDPTLLELQRTQKGLNKRLEKLYMLTRNNETKDKLVFLNPRKLSNIQNFEHVIHRTSTNNLKASLAKNFSILPNQDKICFLQQDQHAVIKHPNVKKWRKPAQPSVSSPSSMSRKENEPLGTQKLNSAGYAPPRNSVKKLIEAFSPAQSLVKRASLRTLEPIKCIRKFGLPSITPSVPLPRGLGPLNPKYRVTPIGERSCPSTPGTTVSPVVASRSDTNEEPDKDDMENLPLPPPEMLIGLPLNSTETSESTKADDIYSEVAKNPIKTTEHHTTNQISQQIKASLCSVDLLPRKTLNTPRLIANSAPQSSGKDCTSTESSLEPNSTPMSDVNQAAHKHHKMKQIADVHKIIPIHNPKEMPEQNENDAANSASLVLTPKQNSPDSLGRNEEMTRFVRHVSPARTPPRSPLSEKLFPSPPLYHRNIQQAFRPVTHRQPSPPVSSRISNPPSQIKMPFLPTQQKLPSPPMGRKWQSSPIHHKASSPLPHCQEATTPFSSPLSTTASPSQLLKGLQNNTDIGDLQQSDSSRIVSNVHSIFYPASSSIFEAKVPLPASSSTTQGISSHPKDSVFVRIKSRQLRQYGDQQQQRRMVLSATHPQPFVRRSFSDRCPRFQYPLPLYSSASSEPMLGQIR